MVDNVFDSGNKKCWNTSDCSTAIDRLDGHEFKLIPPLLEQCYLPCVTNNSRESGLEKNVSYPFHSCEQVMYLCTVKKRGLLKEDISFAIYPKGSCLRPLPSPFANCKSKPPLHVSISVGGNFCSYDQNITLSRVTKCLDGYSQCIDLECDSGKDSIHLFHVYLIVTIHFPTVRFP